jgi:trimeric autotransporter adhesin
MNNLSRYLNPSIFLKAFGFLFLGLATVATFVAFTPSDVKVSGSLSNFANVNGKHNLSISYYDTPYQGRLLKKVSLENVDFVNSEFDTSYSTRLFDKPLFAYAEVCVDIDNSGNCQPVKAISKDGNDVNSCQREYVEGGLISSWSQFLGKKQSAILDMRCIEVINPATYSPRELSKSGELLGKNDFEIPSNPTSPSSLGDNDLGGKNSNNPVAASQRLNLEGQKLSITGGNSVTFPDFINQAVNNIQNFFNTDQTIVNQVSSDINDNDKQKISLNGNNLAVENGNSVDLSSLNLLINTNNLVNGAITFDKLANCTSQNQVLKYYVIDPDAAGPLKSGWNCESPASFSDTDQQTLSFNTTTNQLTILGGNSITLPNGFTGASVVGSGVNQTLKLTSANGNIVSIALPDNDTIYSAGTGINILSGNTIENTGILSLTGVGPLQVTGGQNATVKLSPCNTVDQILKWNGTLWACVSDNDTQYISGTGLALNGNIFSNTGIITATGTTGQIVNNGTLQNPVFALAPIGVDGIYGSSTSTNIIVTDTLGRVVSVTPTTITPAASSITGAQNLTPASNKVVVIGGTGAVLTAATVDINEVNLSLQNIGGVLSSVQQNAIALQNLGGALSIAQQGNILLSNLSGSLSSTQLGAINLSTLGGKIDLTTQVAGALPIANGGTGATTSASARTNLGVGSIATQDANNVAITGGNIDGTAIGAVNPSTGSFTSISSTGLATLNGVTNAGTTTNTGLVTNNGGTNTSTLNTTGLSTLTGIVNYGALTQNGNVTTIGNTTNTGTLTQNGNSIFNGNISTTGSTTTAGLTSTGPNSLSGGTTINGSLTLDPAALASLSWIASDGTNTQSVGPNQTLTYNAGSNLTVSVSPTRQVTYGIVGTPTFAGLDVTGASNLGSLTTTGNNVFGGNTTANNFTATGSTSLNGLTNTGALIQNGNSTFNGTTNTTGTATFVDTNTTGNSLFNNLTATGNTILNTLTSLGASILNGLTNNGLFTQTGDVAIVGDTTQTGNVTTTGNNTTNGNTVTTSTTTTNGIINTGTTTNTGAVINNSTLTNNGLVTNTAGTTTTGGTTTDTLTVTGSTTTGGIDSTGPNNFSGSTAFAGPVTFSQPISLPNGTAESGTQIIGGKVRLGGNLLQPTIIGTDATNTLALTGLQTGLSTDSILIQDPTTGVIKNISASSLLAGSTTNTLVNDTINGFTSTVNGVSSGLQSIINTVANDSSTNTLTTTVNGVTGTGVSIINTNAVASTGNNFTSTVNGVTSNNGTIINSGGLTSLINTLSGDVNGVSLGVVNLINSNTLVSSGNTIESLVNGVSTGTQSIINSNILALSGSDLTSTINGVASTPLSLASINCTTSTTTFCQNGNSFGADAVLGTNDAFDLNFKVNGVRNGSLQTVSKNVFFGENAGLNASNTSGATYNVGIGTGALQNNTTGLYNSAIGLGSLQSNTTGSSNISNGYYSLYGNTTGSSNIGIGQNTLTNNSAGNNNIAFGYLGQLSNTTGSSNLSLGASALAFNVTGSRNVAIGENAGFTQTAGDNNILLGYGTQALNPTGSDQLNIGNVIFGTGINGSTASPAGKIGIGTAAPSAQFTTTEDVRFAGIGTNTADTNILTTDGLGNVTTRTINSLLGSATTNTLVNDGTNGFTSTVNGISSGLQPIININVLAASGTNGFTSSVNGITSGILPIINSVANNSTGNTLTATVNGVTGTGVNIINSNLVGSTGNNFATTVNGVISNNGTIINSGSLSSNANTLGGNVNGVSLGNVNLINSNALVSSGNSLESLVNGISTGTQSIINNNALTLAGTTLTSDVNGITSALDLQPLINAGTTVSNSLSGTNLTTTVNGVTGANLDLASLQPTADNGLTINPSNNVQLGGALIQDTIVDGQNGFNLDFLNNIRASFIGLQTQIGGQNTFNTTDPYQIAIGHDNTFGSTEQYITGYNNSINAPGSNSVFLTGYKNQINNNSVSNLYSIGNDNNFDGGNDLFNLGSSNNFKSPASLSGTVGFNNLNYGSESFLIGSNLVTSGDQTVSLGTNDSTKVTIDNAGRLTLRGALSPNGNDGAANQVLISQGAGVIPAWTDIANLVPATTNTLVRGTGGSVNNLTSTVNGVQSITQAIGSNAVSLSGSNLTTTVNGVASNSLNLLPLLTGSTTNTLANNGTNGFTSTVNGISSGLQSIITSNTLVNNGINTLTNTTNGVVGSASIINTNLTTSVGNTLTNSTNGVGNAVSIINTNTLSLNGTGQLVSTVNGIAGTGLTLPSLSLGTPAGSNANGGAITSNVLNLSFADLTNPGLVSTGIQNFAGLKTFNSANTDFFNGANATNDVFRISPNAGGGTQFVGNLTTANLTGAKTWTLPDVSGTVCLRENCLTSIAASTGTTGLTLTPTTGGTGAVTQVLAGNLAIANGGTGSTTVGPAGTVAFSNGTNYNFTTAGTIGQVLSSNGAGTPTWINAAPAVTTNTLTASGAGNNTLNSTVNGILATSPIVGSNTLLNNGTNSFTSTVNGVSSGLQPIINTVANNSTANTLTTTVNGVAGAGVNIINSNGLALSGSNLTSTINGVASTALNLANINCTNSTTIICQNGNTLGSFVVVGSNDNQPLLFETNNVEKARISASGQFLIGTPSGIGRLTNYAGGVSNGNGVGGSGESLNWGTTSGGGYAASIYQGFAGAGTYGLLTKLEDTANNSRILTLNSGTGNGTDRFVVSGAGNVGIGTGNADPSDRLQVNSNIANNSGLTLTQLTSASPAVTGSAIGVDFTGKVVRIASAPATTSNILTSAGNVMTSNVNGVSQTANIINTSLTSNNGVNFINTTINGITSLTNATIIGSNSLSFSGTDLTSTINGVASNNLTLPSATSGTTGLLTAADFTTFNSKENALTFAGNGLFSRTGNTITGSTCATTNQILKWNGTAFACAADNDTTYTGSNGILLTGTNFTNTGVLGLATGAGISNTGTAQNPIINNTGLLSIATSTGTTGLTLTPTTTAGAVTQILSGTLAATNGGTGLTAPIAADSGKVLTANGLGGYSLQAPASTVTANNGLTATAGNVQLGGILIQGTNINQAGFNLTTSGAGGLGLGIATPIEKLDVAGNIRLASGNPTDTIYSSNTGGLTLESRGNTFGTVKLTLQNINGSNGALFEQASAANPQLVDFGFKTVTGGQRNLRFETRAGSTFLAGGSPEFEFGLSADPTFVTSDTVSAFRKGNLGVGTLNPLDKFVVDSGTANNSGVTLSQLTSASPTTTGSAIGVDATGKIVRIAAGGSGSVTSVAGSGGTTGLTFTGGPITTAGTLTLGGTLATANGGTGLSIVGTAGQVLTSNGTTLSYTTPTVASSNITGTITNAQLANSTYGTTTGNTGTAPAFSAASTALGGTVQLNIPLASGTGVTSGTISKADYDSFNNKVGSITAGTGLTNTGTTAAPILNTNYGTTAGTALQGNSTTTNIVEGTNLYYTNARGIGSVLTGFTPSTNTVIAATDSIIQGLQKLQAGNTIQDTSINTLNNGLTTANTNITTLQTGLTTANTNITANTTAITALQGVSHSPVTLGTPNGLSLAGQALSLATASGATTGALTSADFTTFNNKLSSISGTGNGLFSVTGGNTVTGATCATTNQILKWSGTAFACSTDSDTTYTAGTGLSLTGTTFANTGLLSIAASTGTTGLTLTPTNTAGSVSQALAGTLGYANGGTGINALVAGDAGKVLTVNGTGTGYVLANSTSGVTTVGTIDSQTKSTNGAVISGSTIYQQTADATNPGLVSTTTQTFAGNKTLAGNTTLNGATTLGCTAITDAQSTTITAAQIDNTSCINITKTTTGQTVNLPTPTNTVVGKRITIISNPASTVSFLNKGQTQGIGVSMEMIWNGSVWVTTGDLTGAGAGSPSAYQLRLGADVATAAVQTSITDFNFTVAPGETWTFQVNGLLAPSGGAATVQMTIPSIPATPACTNTLIGGFNATTSTNAACNSNLNGTSINANDQILYTGKFTVGATGGNVIFKFNGGAGAVLKRDSYLSAYRISGADLAEVYYDKSNSSVAGNIVELTGEGPSQISLSTLANREKAIGIVSTKPGQVIGADDGNGKVTYVALSGRVPVKVTTKNGSIKAGDQITVSDTPGVGQLATTSGRVLGKALTGTVGNADQEITVFVEPGYWAAPVTFDLSSIFNQPGLDIKKDAAVQFVQGNNLEELVNKELKIELAQVKASGFDQSIIDQIVNGFKLQQGQIQELKDKLAKQAETPKTTTETKVVDKVIETPKLTEPTESTKEVVKVIEDITGIKLVEGSGFTVLKDIDVLDTKTGIKLAKEGKAVDYTQMTTYLVQTVKDQQKAIETLQKGQSSPDLTGLAMKLDLDTIKSSFLSEITEIKAVNTAQDNRLQALENENQVLKARLDAIEEKLKK